MSTVLDPRNPQGRRHTLAALIAVTVCAVPARARGFTANGQWTAKPTTGTLTAPSMDWGRADGATFHRTFARLNANLLNQVLGAGAAPLAG
ncbi:transposase family protein [Nocardiopsis dassonvillei]|uniref:transposase family protein n=1 Tax=Nocardiopsis dassonvillei TaxID=2014 RepID=UPI00366D541A